MVSKPKNLSKIKKISTLNLEIMALTAIELEILKTNSLSLSNARAIGTQIESDLSAGGIFPHGANGDFSNPDMEKFRSKWCDWWVIAKILLSLAKVFTGPKADKVLDALLALGNTTCDQ